MRNLFLSVGAIILFFISIPCIADDSALQQLKNANSGTQSTGKTFDGSIYPQPSDAYPKSNGNTTVEPKSTSVETSTGTAGGYDVNTSSGTSSGNASKEKRTGSESTGKTGN